MKTYKSTGTICVMGKFNLIYSVCAIEYLLNEDETFKYVFKPNYSVISLLDSSIFQGIPGLNIDLNEREYIRENRIPTFISERVPSKNREDYYELLAKVNMEFMDPIKYLIKSNSQYSGDKLFVIPFMEKKSVKFETFCDNKTNSAIIKKILIAICAGNDVVFKNQIIDDHNRKLIHDIFMELYSRSFKSIKERQQEGINQAKNDRKYIGRKPIKVDEMLFLETLSKVENKEITAKQAATLLKISIDKFYREKKNLQK